MPQGQSSTDCQQFIEEVKQIIQTVKSERRNNWLVGLCVDDTTLSLDMLAAYYSGMPFTWNGIYTVGIPQESDFDQFEFPEMPVGEVRDQWRVPDWSENPRYDWDHPINDPDSPLGQTMRATYGFRRPFFEQTHHYFAFLKIAFNIGLNTANYVNYEREIQDQLQGALITREQLKKDKNPNADAFYAWVYREAVYDVFLVRRASFDAYWLYRRGIDELPRRLEYWCAENEQDVWSVEEDVDRYYFDFPKEYWPDPQYWPTN